jgi:thioredoxin-like negative regulator of GroEL
MRRVSWQRSKTHRSVLALLSATFAAFGIRADTGVQWYSSVEEASMLAVRQNRPLMIDFWADWCAPCKTMEKEVYSTADFHRAAERFLLVKINYDRKLAVAMKYHVENLPTIVFADSYGNELFRYHGYLGARSLLELVMALPGDVAEFNRLNRILTRDKNDLEALEGMGRSLRTAGLFRASSEYYAKAALNSEAKSEKRQVILNEIGLNFLAVEDAKLAAQAFERCLKEFPDSPKRAEWKLNLGQAYAFGERKQREKARKILQAIILEDPSSPESEKARRILSSL